MPKLPGQFDRSNLLPPVMVAVAAMLWGTDAIWRTDLLKTLTAPAIVFWEHVILVTVTGWLIWRGRHSLRALNRGDWLALAVIGIGASALATVLFTQAFKLTNPTTVILLQKTQPLVAISAAALLLKEPLPARFWPLLPVCLAGAYLISFGSATPLSSLGSIGDAPLGALMALGAAFFWGMGTVLGRRLLGKVSFFTLAALRFTVALPALAISLAMLGWATPSAAALPSLFVLSLVAGLAGLMLYYRGLRGTPAAVATLCELSFPITAIIVNTIVLDAGIAPRQVIGVALLWGGIALMRHRLLLPASPGNSPVRSPDPVAP